MSSKDIRRIGQLVFAALWIGWMVGMAAPGAYAASLIGTGTWQSQAVPAKGTWNADFTRAQDNIAGGITLSNSPLATGGSVAGTITNNSTVTFGVIENGAPVAKFTGTLQGTTVSGTYTAENGDQGVWSGTLTAATP